MSWTYVRDHKVIPVQGTPWKRYGKKEEMPSRIKPYLDTLNDGRVLSLGCGDGKVEIALAESTPQLHYRCIDKDTGVLKRAEAERREKSLKNIEFEHGDNYTVDDSNLSAVIRLRTPADFGRLVPFLRLGGFVFYEGIGEYSDGVDVPSWSEIFACAMDRLPDGKFHGVDRIMKNLKELENAGMRLLEANVFNSVVSYNPEEHAHKNAVKKFLKFRGVHEISEDEYRKIRSEWERWRTKSPDSYQLGYVHSFHVYRKH